ncbi:MAG: GAF domain-containing protein [Rubrivivax sp.]|jgi:GAF domain-containing protein/HAMP domain-containing protein|nr:GAF domain-containing protein [Rubrivivax sp.]
MNNQHNQSSKIKEASTVPQLGIFSIANQFRYGLFLLVGLSLLFTAGILIYLSFQAQLQQVSETQKELSRAAAGEINTYLDDLQRKLGYLARIRGLANLPPEIQQSLIEGLTRHNDAYESVAVLNRNGQVIAGISPHGVPLTGNLADSPPFLRSFKQQEDYVGPVEIDPTTNLPVVTLAVPIRDLQDEVAGILLARVNLEYLWFVVSETHVGETGYAYILDNRNFLITQPGSTADTFKLRDVSDQPFVRRLTSGPVDTERSYQGLQGQSVLGAIAPVRSVRWNVVVELPTAEAYAPIRSMLGVMGLALLIALLMTVGAGIYFSRQIVLPLQRLTEASAQISAGNMQTRVDITSRNELGILAGSFNDMTAQLEDLYTTLEQRVISRTRRLEVAASLGERLSSILKLEELLGEVVNQIKDNFGYYHAHIYLLDEKRENLVVAEGTGEAGAEMKARRHSIRLDAPTSLVARAARSDEVVRVDNVREASDWLPNPLLPDTYSEMAVPITLGVEGQVVGVLDVQEDKIAGLDEGDASLLRSLSNQVAVSMRNARLFAEVETALAEARIAQERYLETAWDKTRIAARHGQYHYARPDVPALDEATLVEAKRQALAQGHLAVVPVNNSDAAPPVVAPVTVRDTRVGILQLYPAKAEQPWTEDDLAIVGAVVEELGQAAENLRLFDETRERAGRERVIREITDKLRAAPNLNALVNVAARELGEQLGVPHLMFELGREPGASPKPDLRGNGHKQ